MYIYLSNENETPVEVFFDDFKVVHTKGPVVQSEEYYPFGLTFNSYQKESGVTNLFQYNGKERQDELGLGWLDYGARMFMPDIGRWNAVDPMGEHTNTLSHYHYAYNNPVLFIDPDGMLAEYNWNSQQYEEEDEAGTKYPVSWSYVKDQIKDGVTARSTIKGKGNIAVWNYLSSTEDTAKKVDVKGMDEGNENWDILETENGDLGAVLQIMQAYKKLSLAVNNVAISQHGNSDLMFAVQDENGFQRLNASAVKLFLEEKGTDLMKQHLSQLQQIAKGIAGGGNLFFLSCFSGSNGKAGGLPNVLGNMLVDANQGINVWMPIGDTWAGQGKREVRFGDKGVEAGTNSGWTIVNKYYTRTPHQTAGVIRLFKTGKPFSFGRK